MVDRKLYKSSGNWLQLRGVEPPPLQRGASAAGHTPCEPIARCSLPTHKERASHKMAYYCKEATHQWL